MCVVPVVVVKLHHRRAARHEDQQGAEDHPTRNAHRTARSIPRTCTLSDPSPSRDFPANSIGVYSKHLRSRRLQFILAASLGAPTAASLGAPTDAPSLLQGSWRAVSAGGDELRDEKDGVRPRRPEPAPGTLAVINNT